ncbi:MAG TPA: DUF1801 domain-containing protein [Balneolales bacterium]|nr:DUF1801 domain-containing protein [Balneolales bacterium]
MKKPVAKDVDAYIAGASKDARSHLKALREIIQTTIPEVEETISWGVPFYKYHGQLGGFAVYKNHVSFGIAGDLQNEDRQKLEKDGYKTGKKTIQIQFDQKVPATMIKQVLLTQVKMNNTKK